MTRSFESFPGPGEQERIPGHLYEADFLPPVEQSNWDGERYVKLRERGGFERANEYVYEWVREHVPKDYLEPYRKKERKQKPHERRRGIKPTTSGITIDESSDEITTGEWEQLPSKVRRAIVRRWVKEHQPEGWNPAEPVLRQENHSEAPVSNRAMDGIKFAVEEALDAGSDDVKLYTSLNTPLDTLYGTDAIVEYKGMPVTLDITRNPHKQEGKADVTFTIVDPEEKDAKEKEYKDIGREIAQKIQEKIERRQARRGS